MEKKQFKEYSAQWTYLSADDIEADKKKKADSYVKTNVDGIEIYQPDENYEPIAVEVKFYKNDQYIYSKIKNSYRTNDDKFMLLEWFDDSDPGDKTLLIFNEEHGMISIYDADTGAKIHSTEDSDVFISDFKFFDNREYLYISGWIWQPFSIRGLFHVPMMLKTPDYEPEYISCADVEYGSKNNLNPGITLLGCESCKELLERKDEIYKKMYNQSQTDRFNKNRSEDILLKRFLDDENKGYIEFNGNTKLLLENILLNDRKEFRIDVYGNGSGDRLNIYDGKLYEKAYTRDVSYDADNKMISTPETDFNKILARTVFHQIEHHPFDQINLRFQIYSDIGNLNIFLTHRLVLCDEFKHQNDQQNVQQNDQDDYYAMCVKRNKYKIDVTTPIKIICDKLIVDVD